MCVQHSTHLQGKKSPTLSIPSPPQLARGVSGHAPAYCLRNTSHVHGALVQYIAKRTQQALRSIQLLLIFRFSKQGRHLLH